MGHSSKRIMKLSLPVYFTREEYDLIVNSISNSDYHESEVEFKIATTVIDKLTTLSESYNG
jgi:hypothetical protein